MRNLLDFIIRHSSWLFFLVYAITSLVLMFRFNPFHQSVFFTSSNQIVGQVYTFSGDITSYFNLKHINEDLLDQNARLEMKVNQLQMKLRELDPSINIPNVLNDSALSQYNFIIAQVINNSISNNENYITLNKGLKDGIRPEMGVVDQNGVVGITGVVSDHYTVVISLLNPKWRLSCKVLRSDYFGSLVWDGKDSRYAILEELPRHVEFAKGDTIITSGHSGVFPQGLFVGTVEEFKKQKNDNFYALKIRLATDFSRMNSVKVFVNNQRQEQEDLEQQMTDE